MNKDKGTSPWVWVGCGCGLAVLAAVGLIVGLGWLGVRTARDFQEDMADPAARQARALRVLGADQAPEGYYGMLGVRIPLLMEMAMLSDLPPEEGDDEPQGFGERGFFYFEMITFGRQQDELRDFFEGRSDNAEVLRQQSINIRLRDRLANGEIPRDEGRALWVAHRGSIDAMGSSSEGITTLILFECPEDRRMRMGIWFGPHPDPGTAEEAPIDLAGTNADGEEIARFTSGMRPCG